MWCHHQLARYACGSLVGVLQSHGLLVPTITQSHSQACGSMACIYAWIQYLTSRWCACSCFGLQSENANWIIIGGHWCYHISLMYLVRSRRSIVVNMRILNRNARWPIVRIWSEAPGLCLKGKQCSLETAAPWKEVYRVLWREIYFSVFCVKWCQRCWLTSQSTVGTSLYSTRLWDWHTNGARWAACRTRTCASISQAVLYSSLTDGGISSMAWIDPWNSVSCNVMFIMQGLPRDACMAIRISSFQRPSDSRHRTRDGSSVR